ncbi:MAG: lytic transglycosylase domain-containing protein [Desulfuromonadaceae bacterium]|nr:lytic transglycosylase domain-containing protein [Desulfuromonadaceae bacterium]
MSLTVDAPTFLTSLTPLRQKSDSITARERFGFADKFDKALENVAAPVSTATSKARELAQSLTMQMLESSLSIAGDYPENSAVPAGTTQFSSAHNLIEIYRANLAAGGEAFSPQTKSTPSQLKDFTDAPTESVSAVQPSKVNSETSSWLDPIISRAAQKYGVDAGLIKAVIKAESDFNPEAVSHAGARGLMQLMPATARSLGVTDSFDPEQNVMGGTRFLRDLLHRYDGNVDSALAAYNWGPGNIDKRPELLPRETRDYLARVKQLYAVYNT